MEKQTALKKCLLIAPGSFYSYSEYLKTALTSCGYIVTVSNDEYPANTIGKIMGKLRIPLLLRLTNKTIKHKFLNGKRYDLILIIKGRGMSIGLIKQLNEVSPRVIGYNFDSFKYNAAPLKWFKYLSQYYTFDYLDGEKYNLSIVELFSSLPENTQHKTAKYEISAIIRNHSDRLRYIDSVLSSLSPEKKFIYIFEQNIFTFIQNFLKSPFLYFKYRKYISFKSLPYSEYTKVLQESNFTIDFAHPTQSGITIRCFEALSSQTKIITNNIFVLRYKYFNKTNTIIFNNGTSPYFLKEQFNKIEKHTPDKNNRSINQFIEELIS